MRQDRINNSQAILSCVTGAMLACILGLTGSPSFADKKGQFVAFRPAITPMVDVVTPQGSPRVYGTSAGSRLWSSGSSMVIYRGDKVKVGAFVSTGAFELQHVDVRLDNGPLVSIYRQPWDTSFDTSALDPGYHLVQIWAQSDSPSPYSTGEQDLSFYLALPGDAGAVAPSIAPASSMLTTKVLSDTMTIGDPGSSALTSDTSFEMPGLLSDKAQTISAMVDLLVPSSRQTVGRSLAPITLDNPTVVTLALPDGSTATRCCYALYRDGSMIFQCRSLLPAVGTTILLQARSASRPGLLPGDIMFKAWGVDDKGSYCPEVSLDIRVPASTN